MTMNRQRIDLAKQIIETRVNAFGVTEPVVQRHGGEGSYQILIQIFLPQQNNQVWCLSAISIVLIWPVRSPQYFLLRRNDGIPCCEQSVSPASRF